MEEYFDSARRYVESLKTELNESLEKNKEKDETIKKLEAALKAARINLVHQKEECDTYRSVAYRIHVDERDLRELRDKYDAANEERVTQNLVKEELNKKIDRLEKEKTDLEEKILKSKKKCTDLKENLKQEESNFMDSAMENLELRKCLSQYREFFISTNSRCKELADSVDHLPKSTVKPEFSKTLEKSKKRKRPRRVLEPEISGAKKWKRDWKEDPIVSAINGPLLEEIEKRYERIPFGRILASKGMGRSLFDRKNAQQACYLLDLCDLEEGGDESESVISGSRIIAWCEEADNSNLKEKGMVKYHVMWFIEAVINTIEKVGFEPLDALKEELNALQEHPASENMLEEVPREEEVVPPSVEEEEIPPLVFSEEVDESTPIEIDDSDQVTSVSIEIPIRPISNDEGEEISEDPSSTDESSLSEDLEVEEPPAKRTDFDVFGDPVEILQTMRDLGVPGSISSRIFSTRTYTPSFNNRVYKRRLKTSGIFRDQAAFEKAVEEILPRRWKYLIPSLLPITCEGFESHMVSLGYDVYRAGNTVQELWNKYKDILGEEK